MIPTPAATNSSCRRVTSGALVLTLILAGADSGSAQTYLPTGAFANGELCLDGRVPALMEWSDTNNSKLQAPGMTMDRAVEYERGRVGKASGLLQWQDPRWDDTLKRFVIGVAINGTGPLGSLRIQAVDISDPNPQAQYVLDQVTRVGPGNSERVFTIDPSDNTGLYPDGFGIRIQGSDGATCSSRFVDYGFEKTTEGASFAFEGNERQPTGFGGTWSCPGRGALTLTQQGDRVTGSYPWSGSGTVSGSVSGSTMTATWRSRAGDHGNWTMTLSPDGSRMDGTWDYATRSGGGKWSCSR